MKNLLLEPAVSFLGICLKDSTSYSTERCSAVLIAALTAIVEDEHGKTRLTNAKSLQEASDTQDRETKATKNIWSECRLCTSRHMLLINLVHDTCVKAQQP